MLVGSNHTKQQREKDMKEKENSAEENGPCKYSTDLLPLKVYIKGYQNK